MSFWSRPSTATALLALIAVLLLILVIQEVTDDFGEEAETTHASHSPMAGMANPHAGGGMGMPPHQTQGLPPVMDEEGEFDHAQMIFVSLSCPDDPVLTLGDPGCSGSEVEKRKKMVREAMAKETSIREVYDQVVAQFGEQALSPQAMQIRRMRTGTPTP